METRRLIVSAAILCLGLTCCADDVGPQPNCVDGIQNAGETGVDCGGTCEPCDVIVVGTCLAGACVLPPCENGVRDNQETDVDCGGGTCRKCAGGRACETASDCFGDK